jgi:hypothetical protein
MMRHAFDNGVNYVDSAWGYHGGNSEIAVAQALTDGYRDRVLLATKNPTGLLERDEDFDKYLDLQLGKLQTDHIDFYLQHGLGRDRWPKYKTLQVFERAQKAKQAGFNTTTWILSIRRGVPVWKRALREAYRLLLWNLYGEVA